VNKRAGLTFATGLRAILCSDPDLLMVGEIRDLETAKIALEAALTGHVVYSTLHTNDALGALTRLKDLGVEPSMSASAITAVLAQRLVRRLCEDCREPYQSSRADLEHLGFTPPAIDGGVTLYRARGCMRCTKGYRGRTGVHQLMVMDESLAALITAGAGHRELVAAATASGMSTLWQGRAGRDDDRRAEPRRPLTAGFSSSLGRADQLLDLRLQILRAERLGEIGIGPRRHSGRNVALPRVGRQQHDAGSCERFVRANALCDLDTVESRHLDVEENEPGPVLLHEA